MSCLPFFGDGLEQIETGNGYQFVSVKYRILLVSKYHVHS